MKQIVMGVTGLILLVVSLLSVMTVAGKMARSNELEKALQQAVEQTLSNLAETGAYPIADDRELEADFCQALLQKIKTGQGADGDKNLKIQADIIEADVKKGLLSVHVTEWFTYPNGKVGQISCNATALVEQKKARELYQVTYQMDGGRCQQFGVLAGERLVVPKAPKVDSSGRKFLYWQDAATGNKAVFPETVNADLTYLAVYQ